MECSICQENLVELAYGEVSGDLARETLAHLGACPDCQLVRLELEREAEMFRKFAGSSELDPSDTLWAGIKSQLEPHFTSPPRTPSLFARLTEFLLAPAFIRQVSFAAILVAASIGLTTLYFRARSPEPQVVEVRLPLLPTPTPTPAVIAPSPTFSQAAPLPARVKPEVLRNPTEEEILGRQVRKAAHEYESAIKLLDSSIAKRKRELDPDAVRQYESSLALINDSISEGRLALREHPNDPLAARFLLSAYSRKVELLQEIAMR